MNRINFNCVSTLKYLLIIQSSIFLVFFSSCNSCQKEESDLSTENQEVVNFDSLDVLSSVDAVFYALPSPEEIITYIGDENVAFTEDILHPSDMSKKYVTDTKKVLNLGVYFADLAYITALSKTDLLPEYLSCADYLMKELNIAPDITLEQKGDFVKYINQPDTLYKISRELYNVVINYLQSFDNGKTLALISIGALSESVFIATQLHGDYLKQKDAVKRIAEQELLFEDVSMMIGNFKEDPVIAKLILDFEKVQESFKAFNTEVGVKEVENIDGKLTVRGENKVSISQANYDKFAEAVKEFRQKITH